MYTGFYWVPKKEKEIYQLNSNEITEFCSIIPVQKWNLLFPRSTESKSRSVKGIFPVEFKISVSGWQHGGESHEAFSAEWKCKNAERTLEHRSLRVSGTGTPLMQMPAALPPPPAAFHCELFAREMWRIAGLPLITVIKRPIREAGGRRKDGWRATSRMGVEIRRKNQDSKVNGRLNAEEAKRSEAVWTYSIVQFRSCKYRFDELFQSNSRYFLLKVSWLIRSKACGMWQWYLDKI